MITADELITKITIEFFPVAQSLAPGTPAKVAGQIDTRFEVTVVKADGQPYRTPMGTRPSIVVPVEILDVQKRITENYAANENLAPLVPVVGAANLIVQRCLVFAKDIEKFQQGMIDTPPDVPPLLGAILTSTDVQAQLAILMGGG